MQGLRFKRWGTTAAMLLFALGWLLGLAPAAQAARLALVIGNDQYRALEPLVNAAKDARDVAAELRDAGFEVPEKWVVQNGTRNSMRAALQDFLARLTPDDEVVFYYSGHGVEIDAQAVMVPVDLSDPTRNPLDGSVRPLGDVELAKQQVLDESITLNRVATDIAKRGVKFSLIIADACRDNPIVEMLKKAHGRRLLKGGGIAPSIGLLISDAAADTQVLLFSARQGQKALDRLRLDDPERNGVFTRVLLKAMRTPNLGLRDLVTAVKADVKTLAATVRIDGQPHVQEPQSISAYESPDFYFRPSKPAKLAANAGDLYVLSIGVGLFQSRDIQALDFSAADARGVAAAWQAQEGKAFRKVEVRVLVDADATREAIADGLEWLQSRATKKDLSVVFLAGHSMQEPAAGYSFIPVNADPDRLRRSSMPLAEVTAVLAASAGQSLLLFDMCRKVGLGSLLSRAADGGELSSFHDLIPERGLVITACASREASSFSSQGGLQRTVRHRPFAQAVIDGLTGAVDKVEPGSLTLLQLEHYVRVRVKSLTSGQQTPVTWKGAAFSDMQVVVDR